MNVRQPRLMSESEVLDMVQMMSDMLSRLSEDPNFVNGPAYVALRLALDLLGEPVLNFDQDGLNTFNNVLLDASFNRTGSIRTAFEAVAGRAPIGPRFP